MRPGLALFAVLVLAVLTALPADARHRHHRGHRGGDAASAFGSVTTDEVRAGERRGSVAKARGWSTYVTPSAETAVDLPQDIFSKKIGSADKGSGDKFQTEDGRAQLTVYDLANEEHDNPRSYLDRHLILDRHGLDYWRVTDKFFAISGTNDQLTFYSRCNFSGGRGTMHCLYVAYPQNETRAWDGIVTRLSLSLRGREPAQARRSD